MMDLSDVKAVNAVLRREGNPDEVREAMVAEIERLQAENAKLRVALGFYADPRNWEHVRAEGSQLHSWVPRAAIDRSDTEEGGVKPMRGGKRARAALAPKEKATE